MKPLTHVPGEDAPGVLSLFAEHFDPATNTTLSVDANVAKDGKRAFVRLEYERTIESTGPETGRPTRILCNSLGLFNAKAARAPKSR
jgi:hypothetical protein